MREGREGLSARGQESLIPTGRATAPSDERTSGLNTALMFSKASDEWETPQPFFAALRREFDLTVDAAASPGNKKLPDYFGPGSPICEDALVANWSMFGTLSRMWCNPPYSRCAEFVAKAAAERLNGVLTVMLIPSRTDTRYWHAHIWDVEKHQPREGIELRFVKGRLKFGNQKNCAPFPSVVVVFRPTVEVGTSIDAVDPVVGVSVTTSTRANSSSSLFRDETDRSTGA